MVSTGAPMWQAVRSTAGIARYRDPAGREHTVEVRDHPVGTRVTIVFSPRWPRRAMELPGPRSRQLEFGLIALAVAIGLAALAAASW